MNQVLFNCLCVCWISCCSINFAKVLGSQVHSVATWGVPVLVLWAVSHYLLKVISSQSNVLILD